VTTPGGTIDAVVTEEGVAVNSKRPDLRDRLLVREAIEAAAATLWYLRAYSPDLNPIEQPFSKLRAALRKGAARTVTRLLKLIGRLAKTLAPEECANYFEHAGYSVRPTSSGKCS
jgi:transposase